MAESIEMPFGGDSGGSEEPDSPKTTGNFKGLSGPSTSIVTHFYDIRSKEINSGISATLQPPLH